MIEQTVSEKTRELFKSREISSSLSSPEFSEQVLRVFGKPVHGIEKISDNDMECVAGGNFSIRGVLKNILMALASVEVVRIGYKIYKNGGFSRDGKGIISKSIRICKRVEDKFVEWLS